MNAKSSAFIHVAKIRYNALPGASLCSYRFDERPVVVLLSVFVDGDLTQKHGPIYYIVIGVRKGVGLHYMDF